MTIYDTATQNLIDMFGDQFGRYQSWQSNLFGIDQEDEQRRQALAQRYGQNALNVGQTQASGQNDLTNYGITQGFARDASNRRSNLDYDQASALYGLQTALAQGDAALASQFASRLYGLQSGEAGTARDQSIRDLALQWGQETATRNTPYIQRGLANSGFQQDAMALSNAVHGNAQTDIGSAYDEALARAAYGRDYTTANANQQASNTAAMGSLRTGQAGQDRDYNVWAADGRYNTGQQALQNDVGLRNAFANQNADFSNSTGTSDYDLWARQAQQGFNFWDRQSREQNAARSGIRAAGNNASAIQNILNQLGG